MNIAEYVVGKFGGQAELARLIEKPRSTVNQWTRKGVIPAKWQSELLQLAREHGIDLAPSDFIELPAAASDSEDAIPAPPIARWQGTVSVGDAQLPVWVLEDGRRVISRTGATTTLIGRQGGGQFEQYVSRSAVAKYLPDDWTSRMIEFSIPEIVNRTVLGMSADLFLDICQAYVRARDEGATLTTAQAQTAVRASIFVSACAKLGLDALIDEATGYQYERAPDALQIKLKMYLEEEMRRWEKTFPDELWREFGRLTNWEGSLQKRPKYWGLLVMQLVYEYLDPDVATWLRKNSPKPQHGQNYHQWLSSQYGLKKLVEHLWMLIGMASACQTMPELKARMAERFGRVPVQYTFYLPQTPQDGRKRKLPVGAAIAAPVGIAQPAREQLPLR